MLDYAVSYYMHTLSERDKVDMLVNDVFTPALDSLQTQKSELDIINFNIKNDIQAAISHQTGVQISREMRSNDFPHPSREIVRIDKRMNAAVDHKEHHTDSQMTLKCF